MQAFALHSCYSIDMKKICPKCGKEFECVHSVDCWCVKVKLTDEAKQKLKIYNDCLCKECLESFAKS